MHKLIKNALVFQGTSFKYLDVEIIDGYIHALNQSENRTQEINNSEIEIIDANGKYLSPGFIDIHTHGAVHEDVNKTTPQGIRKISDFFASQGTTSWLMSILTDEPENTYQAISVYNEYQNSEKKINSLIGIHLEGPFLSHKFRGSMPGYLLQSYNQSFVDFCDRQSQGAIKYITLAPEVDGVLEAIPKLVEKGIVVSIGHSGATYEVAREAIQKGAKSCTHTFNAMGLFHQHFPRLMGAVLESNQVYCEAICDGKHLHPGTIRMLIKTMGLEKVIMITDSIMATGMPDGQYRLGVNEIVVTGGDAKLKNDPAVRAGSTLTMNKALKNMLQYTDLSIGEILQMMTINPAKLLNIESELGTIEVGKRANMVRLGLDGEVLNTWIDGEEVWAKDY